jgi:glycosyltransferase involved in cell wall biosynthesis
MKDLFQVAIILPAFNEEKTIGQVVHAMAQAAPPGTSVVVVDNRSTDRTAEEARRALRAGGIAGKVLHEPRPGKGNAVRKALREIRADVYVMCDADATYLPTDLPRLLAPVLEGRADLVVGNRHENKIYSTQNKRPFHDLGNALVRKLINLLFRSKLEDIMSGYRVMSYRFVKNFPVLSDGFELETEMTLHAVDKKLALLELPIGYVNRPEGSESKLNTISDGLRVLKTIFWIFKDYRPLLFFFILSLCFFMAGLIVGTPVILDFMEIGLVPKFPSAILASGLIIISILCLGIGLILDTVAKFQRMHFELQLLQKFPHPFAGSTLSDS